MVRNNKSAFSLVELSIVIIILGLLVASVTVGKDLIQAAQLRGLISQIHGFETQTSTFKLKYNALPGDIKNADKRGLGTNNGDGDGVIEDATAGGDPDKADYEIVYFWQHLNLAGFADGAYDGDDTNGALGETFPKAKHGGGIVVYGVDGVNYYHIGIADSTTGTPSTLVFDDTLVPEDAFSIDNKLDDGFPLKGKVVARAECATNPTTFTCANTAITTTSGGASTTAGTACVLQAGGSQDANLDEYDFETTTIKCQLRMQMNN